MFELVLGALVAVGLVLGTNGGGYFNANSSHPFENATAWTNVLQINSLLTSKFDPHWLDFHCISP